MTDFPKPKPPVKPEPKKGLPELIGVPVSTKPKKPFVPKPHLTQRPFRVLSELKKQL